MENITKVPVHVSMIMDGNGRWAKERGKERVYGHFEGVESVTPSKVKLTLPERVSTQRPPF